MEENKRLVILKPDETIPKPSHDQAVIIWGRFQPMHKGHLHNVQTAYAKYHVTSDIYIVPSSTCDLDMKTSAMEKINTIYNKLTSLGGGKTTGETCDLNSVKNPLTIIEKIKIMLMLRLPDNVKILYMGTSQITDILDRFFNTYNSVIMVLGADQMAETGLKRFIDRQFKTKIKQEKLKFDSDETRLTEMINGVKYDVSATLVRTAIYYNQKKIVQGLMNNPDNFEQIWDILHAAIIRSLSKKRARSDQPSLLSEEKQRLEFINSIKSKQVGGFFSTFLSELNKRVRVFAF